MNEELDVAKEIKVQENFEKKTKKIYLFKDKIVLTVDFLCSA